MFDKINYESAVNYDRFHSYILDWSSTFSKSRYFFKRKLTFLTFSLKICCVLITHYRVVAIVLFSRVSVVRERCNKNVPTFRSFVILISSMRSLKTEN